MVDPVRWGFLGAGAIARDRLAPAVHAAPAAVLDVAAARDPARAAALAPVRTAESYVDLLADPRVEAVYISLHNTAHLPWTVRALEAGKHVLCEKPLGVTVSDVDQMIAAAGEADRLLVEAAWNRWHPRTRDLERLLETGAVGEVRHVVSRFDGIRPAPGNYRLDPAYGGGALLDVGCYAVAAALAAFGWQEPTGVTATAQVDGGVDITIEATLTFAGGGTAAVAASLVGREEEEFTVTGNRGSLSLGSDAFTAWQRAAVLDVDVPDRPPRRQYDAVDPYQLMVAAVSEAVRGRPAWLLPLTQSRAIAATLDRIRAAAESR